MARSSRPHRAKTARHRFEALYSLLFLGGVWPRQADAVEIATTEQSILRGDPANASEPFAAALLDDSGQVVCSAAWLGAGVAVTAAHCLFQTDPETSKLAFGDRAEAPEHVGAVVATTSYPHYDVATGYGDLALLLTQDFDVPSIRVNRVPLTPVLLGLSVRVVGFGKDSAGALGVKLVRDAEVSSIERDSFTYASTVCHGDSGGPAVLELDGEPTLVGVTSTTGENCTGHSRSSRVDPFGAWLEDESKRLIEAERHGTSPGCALVATARHVNSLPHLALGLWLILPLLRLARQRKIPPRREGAQSLFEAHGRSLHFP